MTAIAVYLNDVVWHTPHVDPSSDVGPDDMYSRVGDHNKLHLKFDRFRARLVKQSTARAAERSFVADVPVRGLYSRTPCTVTVKLKVTRHEDTAARVTVAAGKRTLHFVYGRGSPEQNAETVTLQIVAPVDPGWPSYPLRLTVAADRYGTRHNVEVELRSVELDAD